MEMIQETYTPLEIGQLADMLMLLLASRCCLRHGSPALGVEKELAPCKRDSFVLC
jgi:hypothetical protein